MGPVNARPLQDVQINHCEGNREEKPGRFLTTRAWRFLESIGQHLKMFKQVRAPPSHVKERAFPKQVAQEGDETNFAAYNEESQNISNCKLGLCAYFQVLVLARHDNARGNRPRLDAVCINGYRGPTTNGNEPDNSRVRLHKRSLA